MSNQQPLILVKSRGLLFLEQMPNFHWAVLKRLQNNTAHVHTNITASRLIQITPMTPLLSW